MGRANNSRFGVRSTWLRLLVALAGGATLLPSGALALSPDLPPVNTMATLAGSVSQSDADGVPLQLEVFVRGEPINLLGSFRRDAEGRLWAKARELKGLGIKPPAQARQDQDIELTRLTGVQFDYDEANQRIDFTLDDTVRLPREYDLYKSPERIDLANANFGFVLNYQAFTSIGSQDGVDAFALEGSSVNLDARLSTPVGVLSQTGFVTTNRFDAGSTAFRRLDTAFSWTDAERAIVWRAGDTISGGFAWTRPIRIGGLQAQRNFAVRPDLITMPLPGAAGVANVPSVVDVYVNGFQTSSQQVGAGPYRLTNIPALVGQGDARIVVRDASGRVVETTNPFYVSGKLLREGMWNFSVEAGYPRLGYGAFSGDYGSEPVGSGSVSAGVSDALTLQAHVEGTRRFGNAGIGAVAALGGRLLASGAVSASYHRERIGYQGYLAGETRLGAVTLSASVLRSFGEYSDLASVTARPDFGFATADPAVFPGVRLSSRPIRSQYSASISAPTGVLNANLNLGYIHYRAYGGERSDIVTAGLGAPLPWRGSAYVSVWADLSSRRNSGILAGVSFPLGSVATSISSGRDSSGVYVSGQAIKAIGREPGSYGWRISDREGSQQRRIASGGYRSAYGQAEMTAGQINKQFYGSAQIEGAIVAAGGDVFVTNRIDESYAIVDTGSPSVPVMYENRPAGVTNARGKALIPTLQSWAPNRISIDPTNLPLNAIVSSTQETVAPRDRSGVIVKFGVNADAHSATVIFHNASAAVLPAGVAGKTSTGEAFVVGYDGRAFIANLSASNDMTIETPSGTCFASFQYTARSGAPATVGPITCQ